MYFDIPESFKKMYPYSENRHKNKIYIERPDSNKEYTVVMKIRYPHMNAIFIKPSLLYTTFICDTIVLRFCLIQTNHTCDLFKLEDNCIRNMYTTEKYDCNIEPFVIYKPKFDSKL